jgi:uncharacterized protein YjbJ (UPF0337 family)
MKKHWIEGNWKQLKGAVREQWSKLTDVDLDAIKGKEEQLVGKIQEKYGLSKMEAEKAVAEFKEKHTHK